MFFNKFIPSHILSNLYTRSSLQATEQDLMFSLKNRLMSVNITKVLEASLRYVYYNPNIRPLKCQNAYEQSKTGTLTAYLFKEWDCSKSGHFWLL